jgi:hypothetical protein
MAPRPTPPIIRFLRHVQFDLAGCWVWTGGLTEGYGTFGVAAGNTVRAHRWLYEQIHGPLPSGLEPDHLYRNRACVRPSHLEPVTHAENERRGAGWPGQNARKTRCPQGHSYDHVCGGSRRCRTCIRTQKRAAYARGKAA